MDHLISHKTNKQQLNCLKTKSSILETYYTLAKLKKEKAELCFPNSVSNCEKKLSNKSVYRPQVKRQKISSNAKAKSIKNEKSVTTSIENFYSKNDIAISDLSCSYNEDDEKQIKLLNYESESKPLEFKYSWQDLENWIPPSAKKKLEEENFECEIKYSWQIIGMSSQTSDTLLWDIDFDDDKKHKCEIKYSWQIIGTGTQASLHDFSSPLESDYWDGKILATKYNQINPTLNNIEKSSKYYRYRTMCNESIQTTADKNFQTELTDSRVKYSWENLTKPYLKSTQCT